MWCVDEVRLLIRKIKSLRHNMHIYLSNYIYLQQYQQTFTSNIHFPMRNRSAIHHINLYSKSIHI